jgi:hypothetical protein
MLKAAAWRLFLLHLFLKAALPKTASSPGMKYWISCLTSIFLVPSFLCSDFPAFDWYYLTPKVSCLNGRFMLTSLNPSFAGTNGNTRGQLTVGSENGFSGRSVSAATDFYLPKTGGGVFMNCYSASARRTFGGPSPAATTNRLEAGYAQHILPAGGRMTLIPSLSVSFYELGFDGSAQGSGFPEFPPAASQSFRLRTGFLLRHGHFYAGASASQLIYGSGFQVDDRAPAITIHTSWNAYVSKRTMVNFFFSAVSDGYATSMRIGAGAVLWKYLFVDFAAREEAGILAVGFRHPLLTVALSIDGAYMKSAKAVFSGRTELGVSYTLRNRENRDKLVDFEQW